MADDKPDKSPESIDEMMAGIDIQLTEAGKAIKGIIHGLDDSKYFKDLADELTGVLDIISSASKGIFYSFGLYKSVLADNRSVRKTNDELVRQNEKNTEDQKRYDAYLRKTLEGLKKRIVYVDNLYNNIMVTLTKFAEENLDLDGDVRQLERQNDILKGRLGTLSEENVELRNKLKSFEGIEKLVIEEVMLGPKTGSAEKADLPADLPNDLPAKLPPELPSLPTTPIMTDEWEGQAGILDEKAVTPAKLPGKKVAIDDIMEPRQKRPALPRFATPEAFNYVLMLMYHRMVPEGDDIEGPVDYITGKITKSVKEMRIDDNIRGLIKELGIGAEVIFKYFAEIKDCLDRSEGGVCKEEELKEVVLNCCATVQSMKKDGNFEGNMAVSRAHFSRYIKKNLKELEKYMKD